MFLKACSNMVGGIIARFGRWRCVPRLGRSGKGTGLSDRSRTAKGEKDRFLHKHGSEDPPLQRGGKERHSGEWRSRGPYLAFAVRREYTLFLLSMGAVRWCGQGA